jgi:hypothetical protein
MSSQKVPAKILKMMLRGGDFWMVIPFFAVANNNYPEWGFTGFPAVIGAAVIWSVGRAIR